MEFLGVDPAMTTDGSFFQTDADLDLTVVSCEIIAPELDILALDTTKLSRRALRKGHTVFVMGCQVMEPEDIVILEGQIVGLKKAKRLRTQFRFQTGDGLWMPGSAGFDEFGTFSFIVTKPQKLRHQEALMGSNDAMGASISSKQPKQWASCIQVVKDWVEPLWRMNRDEVFQGPRPALEEAVPVLAEDGDKRPSLQGDPIQKKKSIIPRNSIVPSNPVTTPIRQATLQGIKGAESLPMKPESAPVLHPQKLAEKDTTTTKTVAVETLRENPKSDVESDTPKNAKVTQRIARRKPPDEATIREQRAKREAFTALKKNKGLKRLADKATRTTEQHTDSVSVQTELFVTEADVKPIIIVSRPQSPEGALRPAEPGGGRKGRRERWSLPEDGHGLDFMRAEGEEPLPPTMNRWGRVAMPKTGRSLSMKETESAPPWMDKYYAHGRSRSEYPSRSSSAGTTPPRPRRQVVSDVEADLDHDDSTSVSGSSSHSLQRAESVYFKPTISYMQKRNLNQRDSILARQASQTTLPRWS